MIRKAFGASCTKISYVRAALIRYEHLAVIHFIFALLAFSRSKSGIFFLQQTSSDQTPRNTAGNFCENIAFHCVHGSHIWRIKNTYICSFSCDANSEYIAVYCIFLPHFVLQSEGNTMVKRGVPKGFRYRNFGWVVDVGHPYQDAQQLVCNSKFWWSTWTITVQ